ncbi:MAG: type II toxin-antitoxin system VapC family toxin [Bacteroidia bacterium]
MNLIVDTHVLLWAISNTSKLSNKAKRILENNENQIFVSTASLWEISIKKSIGKLEFDFSTEELYSILEKTQINVITIQKAHLIELTQLEFRHKDPFDRLIISQAIAEKFKLISKDQAFKNYPVQLIW